MASALTVPNRPPPFPPWNPRVTIDGHDGADPSLTGLRHAWRQQHTIGCTIHDPPAIAGHLPTHILTPGAHLVPPFMTCFSQMGRRRSAMHVASAGPQMENPVNETAKGLVRVWQNLGWSETSKEREHEESSGFWRRASSHSLQPVAVPVHRP